MMRGKDRHAQAISTRARWIGIAAVICWVALSAGCGGEDKTGSGGTDEKAPMAKGFAAKVSGVRSATWLEHMLTARTSKGERRLAPGDTIFAGEMLVTAGGLEATLELADRTQVVVAESTELRMLFDDKGPGFELVRGEIRISRPLDATGPMWVGTQENRVTLGSGRFLATCEKGVPVGLLVEAGWAKDGSGQTLVSGRKHLILPSKAPSAPQHPVAVTRPRIVATPLAPLVPKELVRAPSRVPVRGIGTLVARDPRTHKKSGEALDITLHRVVVTVRDGIARTEIEETFTNNSKRTVEGIYKFVLPSDASITRLALDVNGRVEEGEVLEKKHAKRVFKSIVEDAVRPRDPALLEWERSGSFSMRIFPITAGQTRRVFLSYMQPLTAKDGVYEYVYPMSSPAGTVQIGRFEIEVEAALSSDIASVVTPLMQAQAEQNGKQAMVAFAADKFSPSTDFAVRFVPAGPAKEARVASETDSRERTYAMALLSPRIPEVKPAASRRLVAMVDTSYGIPEDLLNLAKQTVLETAAAMGPTDEIAVLACDSDCATFENGFAPVEGSSIIRLAKWLDDIEPGGASNLLGGFAQVFELAKGVAPVDVVYIGDGSPTAGATDVPELVRLLQATRPSNVSVHTIGVGANRDDLALSEIAARLGGAFHRPMVGATPQKIADTFARSLGAASLKNVTITWPAGVESAYPSYLGTLAAGQEIAVVARLAGNAVSGDLVLRGTDTMGQVVERRFPIDVRGGSPRPSAVAKLWARRHFDAMTMESGREKEIVALSRQMKIASRYTSWIVLENDRMYRQFGIERIEAERWDGQAPEFEEVDDLDYEDEGGAASSQAGGAIKGGPASSGYGRGAGALSVASRSRAAKKSAPRPSAKAIADGEILPEGKVIAPMSLDEVKRKRPAPQKGYRVKIMPARQPSAKALENARKAAAEVAQNPMVRTLHRRYVRLLARQGRVEEQLAAAKAWIERDPLEPSALRAFADALARNGERARALRFYSGITELSPNSPKIHRRLGAAHRDLGRYVAAAGHYRVAAASSKGTDEDWQNYFECLAAAGLRSLMGEEARTISSRVKSAATQNKLESIVSSQTPDPSWATRRLNGPLKVHLDVPEGFKADLDIAVIDPGGRRISGVWPRNATVRSLTDPQKEDLAVSWLINGTYRVLVSRARSSAKAGSQGPVTGTVTVKCRDERQTFPFTLQGVETELARISYKSFWYK